MKWKQWALWAASVSALTLAACSNGNESADQAQPEQEQNTEESASNDEAKDEQSEEQEDTKGKISGPAVGITESVENDGDAIEGGTLKVALVSDVPFQGVFNTEYALDSLDFTLLSFSNEGLFVFDENNEVTDKGPATEEVDQDNKTVTIHIKDGVKWSDGEPLTADDIIFTHELLASPDYTGLQYNGEELEKIEGLKDYHEGKADHISGIEKVDDQTVKFHLNEISLSLKYGGGGPWGSVSPKHVLENVPIDQIESSPEVREHPVGLGAFRVTNIVPGESVEYEANEYYWQGKPKIDKIELTRIPDANTIPALENHQYDILLGVPNNTYDTYKETPGYDFLTKATNAYSYLGFKLGKWDPDKGENIPDPDRTLADPKLRQAFGYALDNDLVGTQFYHGLSWNANSLIPPIFEDLHDDEQPGFYYDPDKARQILDEAGYKDVNGDGYVEDKDGNELVFHLGAPAGSETAEPVNNYYIQAWKEVGLHVEYTDGRLLDYQNLGERIQNDDPAIDLFFGAWSLDPDPWPYGASGRKAPLNYSRWATEEQDALFDAMVSQQAFDDPEYQKEQYKKWQEYIVREPQLIPIRFSLAVTPVNKRVKHFDISRNPDNQTRWHEIELTADEPLGE